VTAWTAAEKQAAVDVYADTANLGQAQRTVTREDGTQPGKNTIKRWAATAGHDLDAITERADHKTQSATRAAEMRWKDRRAAMLDDIGATADQALTQTIYYLNANNPRYAKDAATTMAILIDKAQVLSGDATQIVRTPWDPAAVVAEAEPRAELLRPKLVASDGQPV
jgi:hypothetical protein